MYMLSDESEISSLNDEDLDHIRKGYEKVGVFTFTVRTDQSVASGSMYINCVLPRTTNHDDLYIDAGSLVFIY